MELPSFRVVRRGADHVQVLAPTDRITLGRSARDLRQAFDEVAGEGYTRVVINLENVPYVDSAGLGTIVTGLNLFKKIGGTLHLSNVQPRVAQLLELSHLNEILISFRTEELALESLLAPTAPDC